MIGQDLFLGQANLLLIQLGNFEDLGQDARKYKLWLYFCNLLHNCKAVSRFSHQDHVAEGLLLLAAEQAHHNEQVLENSADLQYAEVANL